MPGFNPIILKKIQESNYPVAMKKFLTRIMYLELQHIYEGKSRFTYGKEYDALVIEYVKAYRKVNHNAN